MPTKKLGIWNAALFEVGDYALSDTGEAVTAGRLLTRVYDDVVADCLAAGSWNFATVEIKSEADTGITPNFGPSEVFSKPSDWVRTLGVSSDDRFSNPYLNYREEDDYWVAEASPLYFRYLSNDTGKGLDINNWPRGFTRFVELSLAHRVLPRLSQDKQEKERILRDLKMAKREALNRDAMDQAQPQFPPVSSWTASRGGASRRDRGNRGSLIG